MTTCACRRGVLWLAGLVAAAPACLGAAAAKPVAQLSWSELQGQGVLRAGEVVTPRGADAPAVLRLVNETGAACTFNIVSIERPAIVAEQYALRGQVRCENVEGQGYLEMWSVFEGDRRFFSRTLGESGAMGKLTGSSGWRRFVLPFFMDAQWSQRPERLEINVVLPGPGSVELRGVELVEYASREAVQADLSETGAGWWSGPRAGLIGGVVGGIAGVVGAAAGILAWLGRGRRVALGLMQAMLCFCAIALVVGLVAVLKGQPWEVYYPLLLFGGLGAAMWIWLLFVVRRAFVLQEVSRTNVFDATVP